MEQHEPAPGPYRVERQPTPHSPTTVWLVIRDAQGQTISSLAHDGLPVRVEVKGRLIVRTPEQVEGTAALLAASWGLLDAARKAVAAMRGDTALMTNDAQAALLSLGREIAKATTGAGKRAA